MGGADAPEGKRKLYIHGKDATHYRPYFTSSNERNMYQKRLNELSTTPNGPQRPATAQERQNFPENGPQKALSVVTTAAVCLHLQAATSLLRLQGTQMIDLTKETPISLNEARFRLPKRRGNSAGPGHTLPLDL